MGRVKSLRKNIILKSEICVTYSYVCLCVNNKRKSKRVHRLVAEAFIPNPENKSEVNHIDGNKQNNRVDNLEWVTGSENIQHGYRMNLCKANKKRVLQYDLQGKFIKEWESTMQIQRQLNYNNSCICYCCLGKKKTAYGYKWQYA